MVNKILDFFFSPGSIFILFTVAVIMAFVTEVEFRVFGIPRAYGDRIWLSNITLTFLIYFVSVILYRGAKEQEKEDEDRLTTKAKYDENKEWFRKIEQSKSLSPEERALAEIGLMEMIKGVIPKREMLLQLDKVFGKEVVDKLFGRDI